MKVAIAGYGAEGASNYGYYSAKGDDVTIVDERSNLGDKLPEGAKTLLGEGVFGKLDGFDIVVRTPGLRPDKIIADGKIWSATNEFFAECPAPIIGVTGTKGKGTTCSLITSILRAGGQKVHLVGNIGLPALEVLKDIQPEDVVVYELSSFQLWDLEKSPSIAVVLMIEQDHLDVHHDMDEYVAAKTNITSHQTENDIVIYHPSNAISLQIASCSVGRRLRYAVPDDGQAYVKSNTFFVQDTPICTTDNLQIPGAHNLENACAAISAVLAMRPDMQGYVESGVHNFSGLPHRLKFVREVNDISYYDDSIATTPGSAIAAIRSFAGGKVMILGGSDKGADYRSIVDECKQKNVQVIAIGQTGERIEQLCHELGVDVARVTGGMREVVAAASKATIKGDTVILSPASASFDQFKSYGDRGDQFVAAVEAL